MSWLLQVFLWLFPWPEPSLMVCARYMAVATAGSANVAFTRMDEIQNGVQVLDKNGNALGVYPCSERGHVREKSCEYIFL